MPASARASSPCSGQRAVALLFAVLSVAASTSGQNAPAGVRAGPPPVPLAVTRPIASAEALKARLADTIADAEVMGVTLAMRVVDPATGAELFEHKSGLPVIPASNMKLAVTAAALDHFGADHVFETKLLISGDDLYLVGCGDPSPGDTVLAKKLGHASTWILDRWADEVLEKGKSEFTGSIHYVDNALELPDDKGWGQVHSTWGDSVVEWYGAPISGLNYNDNCLDITVSVPSDAPKSPTQPADVAEFAAGAAGTVGAAGAAGNEGGVTGPGGRAGGSATLPTSRPRIPTRYSVYPEILATGTVINRSFLAEKNTIDIVRADNRNEYVIKGTLGKGTAADSKPVTDPGAFFADALKAQFAHRGITVAGPATRASGAPVGAIPLTPARSVMRDLAWRTNKNSQNLFADALSKMLGRAATGNRGPGSWANGEVAIRAFLKKLGVDDSAYVFADGSGLSRDNRVTTRFISDLLVAMTKHKDFDAFRDSLPIGGVDGTIKSRFTQEKNRVFAKTGTIRGVRSLSGYVRVGAAGEKTLVFSIILNDIPAKLGAEGAGIVQDDLVRMLMDWEGK